MRSAVPVIPLLAALCAASGCAAQPRAPSPSNPAPTRTDPALARRVDSVLRAVMPDSGAPGAAVAVLHRDTIVYLGGAGSADGTAAGRRVTPETIFQIASTTKPFTAMAVMMLVKDGKVELDAPAARYLPWLPEVYGAVTVRQLLTHTSGVARDLRRANVDEFDADDFRARLAASTPSFAPGARWEYANTGYALLSFIVEAASGEEFGAFLRRRIFRPLGMTSTGYRVPASADGRHAVGYDLAEGGLERAPHVFSGFGNSGIESTARDMARWAAAVERGALLRPESWRAVFEPARLASGDSAAFEFAGARSSYGFGWFLTTWRGEPLATHGGVIAGFSSVVHRFPRAGWTVIVLSNRKEATRRVGHATVVADAIAAALEIGK